MTDPADTTALAMARRALPKVLALVAGLILVSVGGPWAWLGLLFMAWVAMTRPSSWWRHVRTGEAPRAAVGRELAEPGAWSVRLVATGPRRIEVIKEVRQTTGAAFGEAKAIASDPPSLVASGLSEGSARRVHERLERAGATAELHDEQDPGSAGRS